MSPAERAGRPGMGRGRERWIASQVALGVPRALAVELADRLVTLASEQHRAETRRVPEALLLEMQAVGKRLAAAMPAERRAVVS